MTPEFYLLPVLAVILIVLALWRRRSRVRTPARLPAKSVVVDGSNVMHWGGAPSAKVLKKVIGALRKRGLSPIVFFDANAGYKLANRYYDERQLARITGLPQKQICVADKGVVADEWILNFATEHGLRVVSNDRFRDWKPRFPMVGQPKRFLRGSYRGGNVIWGSKRRR